tara:strand:- start:1350 stop:1571 length:222 start_codon:yes stop_codon:yes gene_type:complete
MLRQQLNSDINHNPGDVTTNKNNQPNMEYSIVSSFFDPSKFTPPDKFISSLSSRIEKYYSFSPEKKDTKLCMK